MAFDPQNLAEYGSDWLADRQKGCWSSPILYARGTDSVAVRAVIGRSEWGVDSGAGMVIEEVSRDFIILVADLVLPVAGAIVPQRGDRITETVKGQTCVYEVLAPGGQQVWKWGDSFHKKYQIHTKKAAA
jgi:hypothetical protein